MAYVTREELEVYLTQQNYARTGDVIAEVQRLVAQQQQLIAEQQGEFQNVRQEIAATADQVKSNSDEFNQKYADAMGNIQAKIGEIETSQTAMLESMRAQVEVIKAEQVSMAAFNESTRQTTTRAYDDMRAGVSKHVADREQAMTAGLDAKLAGVDHQLNVSMTTLMATARAELGSSGGGHSGPSTGGGPRDRSAFDARDYKVHDLEASPSLAAVRKWRHDVELFTDTLGPSWTGVANMLRNCRLLDQEFDGGSGLMELMEICRKVDGQAPVDPHQFEFSLKSDVLYKLLMPRLNLSLSTEFRQIGSTNGFELFRKVVRKLDPPKSDNTFHLTNEIRGLGGTSVCKDFAQTCRFMLFFESRLQPDY